MVPWEDTFRARLASVTRRRGTAQHGLPVSIKVRVTYGCFHREHSPVAYGIIDRELDRILQSGEEIDFDLEEHESGPELLVYLALGTAAVTLSKSVIDLVTAIIKARTEGNKKGDRPSESLELIVRSTRSDGEVIDSKVMEFRLGAPADSDQVSKLLTQGIQEIIKEEQMGDRSGQEDVNDGNG